MTQTVKQWAQSLEVIKESEQRAALIIGFDGSAKLLGHSEASAFCQSIATNIQLATNKEVRPGSRYMGEAWRNLQPASRRKVLLKHTRADTPDHAAIVCIAELLRHKYLKMIVVSDPNEQFCDILKHEYKVEMERLDCARCRTPVVTAAKDYVNVTPVFVDGADITFASFIPNYTNLEGKEINETHQALKGLIGRFQHVYCWGWSDLNVHLDKVFDSEESQFYLLNDHGDANNLPAQGTLILSSDKSSDVSTAVFKELHTTLFDRLPVNRSYNIHATMTAEQDSVVQEVGTFRLAEEGCLLWPEDVLDKIYDRSQEIQIVIVGTDGALQRSRIAKHLGIRYQRFGSRYFNYPNMTMNAIHSHLHKCAKIENGCVVVVEVGEDPQSASRRHDEPFTVRVSRWLKVIRGTNIRLVLFTVGSWLNSLEEAPLSPKEVYYIRLESKNCVSSEMVTEWINKQGRLFAEDKRFPCDEKTIGKLADYIVERLRNAQRTAMSNGNCGDRLHFNLDLWLHEVGNRLTKGEIKNEQLTLDDLKQIWDNFNEEEPGESDGEDDFPLNPRNRPGGDKPPPSAGDKPVVEPVGEEFSLSLKPRTTSTQMTAGHDVAEQSLSSSPFITPPVAIASGLAQTSIERQSPSEPNLTKKPRKAVGKKSPPSDKKQS